MTSTTRYERVVIVGVQPDIEKIIAQRQELGQDHFDEVWEGEYHMVPGPAGQHAKVDGQVFRVLAPLAEQAGLWCATATNLGTPDDYRVPDQAYFPPSVAPQTYHPTASIVVEVISPGDESRGKLRFYFAAGVREVILVDPTDRVVAWYLRTEFGLLAGPGSNLLDITAMQLRDQITWP